MIERGRGYSRCVFAERPGTSFGTATHVVFPRARRGVSPGPAGSSVRAWKAGACEESANRRAPLVVYVFLFSDAPLHWLYDSTRPALRHGTVGSTILIEQFFRWGIRHYLIKKINSIEFVYSRFKLNIFKSFVLIISQVTIHIVFIIIIKSYI